MLLFVNYYDVVFLSLSQDRITQMEETHHSTNEELQATLQELTDLQDQLAALQDDNKQLLQQKAVLFESLCEQTERLEDSKQQVQQLRQLLIKEEADRPKLQERELMLQDLIKVGGGIRGNGLRYEYMRLFR